MSPSDWWTRSPEQYTLPKSSDGEALSCRIIHPYHHPSTDPLGKLAEARADEVNACTVFWCTVTFVQEGEEKVLSGMFMSLIWVFKYGFRLWSSCRPTGSTQQLLHRFPHQLHVQSIIWCILFQRVTDWTHHRLHPYTYTSTYARDVVDVWWDCLPLGSGLKYFNHMKKKADQLQSCSVHSWANCIPLCTFTRHLHC